MTGVIFHSLSLSATLSDILGAFCISFGMLTLNVNNTNAMWVFSR